MTVSWTEVFILRDSNIPSWKILRIFVQMATAFLTSVAFGLRPDKNLLSSGIGGSTTEEIDEYVKGTAINNVLIGTSVWIIVGLWVLMISLTGAHVRVEAEDDDEEER